MCRYNSDDICVHLLTWCLSIVVDQNDIVFIYIVSCFKLVCLFLSSAVTLHTVHHHHHHHHHQSRIVHCCVQWWMWVMWLSPGTKETVYCPASVCLISAAASLYIWRWNIRIKTTTAVCSTIPSATRPDTWTSVNYVTHVQVQQRSYGYFFTKNTINSPIFFLFHKIGIIFKTLCKFWIPHRD